MLSNCTSVMNFRVGTHLQLGKRLCRLTFSAQSTVFVFKDVLLFFCYFFSSQNFMRLFCFKKLPRQETGEDLEL